MPRAADNPPAIVLGGGIAGLAAARLLTRHYARVVVLERDTRPDVAEPESAYGGWQRRGVPQFRHSHAFLARLRLVLLAHLPEVLDRLRALGVRELGLAALAPPGVTLAPEEGDDGWSSSPAGARRSNGCSASACARGPGSSCTRVSRSPASRSRRATGDVPRSRVFAWPTAA